MEIIDPEKLLLKITPILKDLKISYFITGGLAVSIWGRPRATFDIDIIIKLIEPEVPALVKALRKISKAGYIDEDVAKQAIVQKGEFNFLDPKSGLKIDFWIAKDDLRSKIAYSRRKVKKIHGQQIYFVSPEDLILSKLIWYKESQSSRHLEDIESVLKISKKKLDLKYLKNWAKRLGVLGIFNKLLSS